jgi:hypothetical protein
VRSPRWDCLIPVENGLATASSPHSRYSWFLNNTTSNDDYPAQSLQPIRSRHCQPHHKASMPCDASSGCWCAKLEKGRLQNGFLEMSDTPKVDILAVVTEYRQVVQALFSAMLTGLTGVLAASALVSACRCWQPSRRSDNFN